MLKMVSFSLVNSHLTVLYALVKILTDESEIIGTSEEEGIETTKYAYINGVILSAVLSKALDPILTRYLWRFGKYQLAKFFYFRAVSKKAQMQQIKHLNFDMSKLPAKDAKLLKEKQEISFFNNMFDFNIPDQVPNNQVAENQEPKPPTVLKQSTTGSSKVAPAEKTLS